jgi:hypothetical protein
MSKIKGISVPDIFYCPEGYPTCTFSCRWWQEDEGEKASGEEVKKAGCQHPKLSQELEPAKVT